MQRGRQRPGSAAEWDAVRRPSCWPCCEEGHAHAVYLARELSYQLIREYNTTKYNVHGRFGIFADGDRVNYAVTGKPRLPFGAIHVENNYGHTKTRFIYSRLCELNRNNTINTICEIGFNAGLSAILMLEAARSARLVSFDLADFRWAHRADELVRQHYGRRRFPGVVFGDSSLTVATLKDAAAAAAASTGDVPLVKMDGFEGDDAARLPKSDKQYLQRHTRSGIIPQALAQAIGPPLHCDAGFIDGAKTFTGRLRHILSMRSVSSPGTVVFMDEVTSKECCDGTFGDGDEHAARCKPLNEGYYDATRAYSHAAKRGLLKVVECDWPNGYNGTDGVCMGVLL